MSTDQNEISQDELDLLHRYWSACNYLAAGMIYLRDNPLLREPLKQEHIKRRLLGHWGSSPALSFCYIHLNRVIKKLNLSMIYIAGPGHGAPGVLGPVYLEGTYSEIYPEKDESVEGLRRFLREFSFPGFVGSHCTPETPGSIHEGGELGYSLSHAYGAVLDNPDLIAACVVGDGEAETGPLATAWHSNKFLNPKVDGAVLPILNLNGYKIANPTILARVSEDELLDLFRGYGYTPVIVQGHDPKVVHRDMVLAMDSCIQQIKNIQSKAREEQCEERPRWPMIILRTPKGWTGPVEVDGHPVENTWRAHQVPLAGIFNNPSHLQQLEDWLMSYKPHELFDEHARLIPELKALAPEGDLRMSANPSSNGGKVRRPLELPSFHKFAMEVDKPATQQCGNTSLLGKFLRDVIELNPNNFRLFGPDETDSNRLSAVYEATNKVWMGEFLDTDSDGAHLAQEGRVMEMLSEHTLEGWLEGYLLTGRHGLLHTYEAFAHVIDSMINQHAKWLDICKHRVPWRAPVSSLNILLSSVVWRQDHNGFSHQDPGFIDLVTNKSADVTRIYFPPDANCLLSVADHCLKSENYINLIIADKQPHLQYLSIDQAVQHCKAGLGVWDWASQETDEPDVVLACCGDVPTMEALAAAAILRERVPELQLRFVNVVDLYRLQTDDEHPHGLSNQQFDKIFTTNAPVIFNFHGYPWLIHKLAYRRTNSQRLHVRGYKEKGNINTPLELAILNQIDRFNLVIDVLERVPRFAEVKHAVISDMKSEIQDNLDYVHENGLDKEEITNWVWPQD